MFVAAPFRGRELGAGKLLDVLLAHARAQGIVEIFLGTTDRFWRRIDSMKRRFQGIAESRSAQGFPDHGRRFDILCLERVVRRFAKPCPKCAMNELMHRSK
jgi:GNAT superfamily N-acetyltransferase